VTRKGADFIAKSVRPDGSWPIDTNLTTWVTTLAINALAAAGELEKLDRLAEVYGWLVQQQYRDIHPYTGAMPGGFSWAPLPGAVPDADDTPGAMLALCSLGPCVDIPHEERWHRWGHARNWVLGLQNRDGGWPTFCRGWGHLPFDRSGSDLTAHNVRALAALCYFGEGMQVQRDYF